MKKKSEIIPRLDLKCRFNMKSCKNVLTNYEILTSNPRGVENLKNLNWKKKKKSKGETYIKDFQSYAEATVYLLTSLLKQYSKS